MQEILNTEEHQLFRQSFKEFVKAEIVPKNEQWEKEGKVGRELYEKMGAMGFFGIHCPEELGGSNLDYSYARIINEELAAVGASGVATSLMAHMYLAMIYLQKSKNPKLFEQYLKPSMEGKLVGALAMTEPGAGSDLAAIISTAVKDGDDYIVNGSKTFITNGYYGDYMVAAVKTDPKAGGAGISMLVIDLDQPGISRTKLNKLGIHASDTAEIGMDNVRVPQSNLVGQEGMGFYFMMQNLTIERMGIVWGALGAMQFIFEKTLQYMQERAAFGKPINKFQALRHKIVDLMTEYEACKAFSDVTSYRMVKGEQVVKECSMLKIQSCELLNKVAYECLQMFGGYGFIEEYPIARAYRDARIQNIYGGTSEIMREIVAKLIFDGASYG
ncbi:MAG: acyl-CoA dehydrogenase family protein [Chitinophagales bacterium]|jgi:alkylation response protein AidB-like acyl-CoA dehydrogenase|nr:acyl-CoA dehydrogenase family protein [Chitinophagales bacterium]